MTATLPAWVEDIMRLWPLWAAIGSLLGAWIVWSARTWLKANVVQPIAAMREEVTATRHLAQYHLGPNGRTKPIHRRIADIEAAHGIAAPEPRDWPPMLDGNDRDPEVGL